MNRTVVFSIHDVAPSTIPAVETLRGFIRAAMADVPVSLLVVPRYHDEQWDPRATVWLRGRRAHGDEVVVHGLRHTGRDGRDGAEFTPAQSHVEAVAALSQACAGVRALGVPATGWIAPAYQQGPQMERALSTSGLDWWASRAWLHHGGRRLWLPSVGLGASTAWKRRTSPAAARVGIQALAWSPHLRVDLHPADADDPRLLYAVARLLDDIRDQGRSATTHGRLVRTHLSAPQVAATGAGALPGR